MHLGGCSTPGECKAGKKCIVLENKIGATLPALAMSSAPSTARHIQEKNPQLLASPSGVKEGKNKIDFTSSGLTFQGLA